VSREAELKAPSRVACSDLLDHGVICSGAISAARILYHFDSLVVLVVNEDVFPKSPVERYLNLDGMLICSVF